MNRINRKQFSELEGLYVTSLIAEKYGEDQTENFNFHAKQLDKLKVPFCVQNAVAAAGEVKENWGRYNRKVIKEAILKAGYVLEEG